MTSVARSPGSFRVILWGIPAGVAGTAAMTGHQEIRQWLARRGNEADEKGDPSAEREEPDPWQQAPAPARVGKLLIEGVSERPVPPKAIPVLTQVMHWSYGTLWGGVYAVGREALKPGSPLLRPLFGLGVWAISYAQLVPLGIYEPPWNYPLSSLMDEIGYHLTYGAAVAGTYDLLRDGRRI